MDGVLSNFDESYKKFLDGRKATLETFREATEDYGLFSDLPMLPMAGKLLDVLYALEDYGYNIEILSSINAVNPTQKERSILQKSEWLIEHDINWERNFVDRKEEKCRYATPKSILIDDNIRNVSDFASHYGHGILHVDAQIHDTLSDLRKILSRF